MAWTSWKKLPFNTKGELNTANLKQIPSRSGIYAIATRTDGFFGSRYHIKYVGRTKGSMRDRLANHLRCHRNGSRQVRALVEQKRERPNQPLSALYVAAFPTDNHKVLEGARIKRDDPMLNLLGGKSLPPGLTHAAILASDLS